MPHDIIVSGHLCLDLIPGMQSIPLESLAVTGKMFETTALSIATGGAVSNTGLALHRLGADVGLMATVGDDLLGRIILAALEERDERLSELIERQAGQESSYTIILAPENRDRTFLHCTGTNDFFGIKNIDFERVAEAKIFHLGYPPILPRMYADDGNELLEIYHHAKELGVITSLDMTLPDPNGNSGRVDWRLILEHVLPYVDIFLPSIEEILFMLRREDYDRWHGDPLPHLTQTYLREVADDILAMGAIITGFKLGEMGMYLRTANANADWNRLSRLAPDVSLWSNVEIYQPTYQVEAVGTTGAGDSAYAGFLAAFLRGLSPEDCVRWACAVGACNVESADATSGIRSWEETQARLGVGWQLNDLRLPAE